MTHSFFAQMGGFVIDTNDLGEDQYIPESPRLHLTANGVAVLAELDHLRPISKDFILDKSKADHLAKALVLIQASWLIIQCIARAIQNLPLSLLELNTVAHVGCALIMYFVWWHKPFDVRNPVLLTGEWTRPLTAAMWMFSKIEKESPEIESLVHFVPVQVDPSSAAKTSPGMSQPTPEIIMLETQLVGSSAGDDSRNISRLQSGLSTPPRIVNRLPGANIQTLEAKNNSLATLQDGRNRNPIIYMREGDILLPFGFGPKSSSIRFQERLVNGPQMDSRYPPLQEYYKPPVEIKIDRATISRWGLTCQSLQEHDAIWSHYKKDLETGEGLETRYIGYEYPLSGLKRNFVESEMPNWPGKDLIPHASEYSSAIFFFLCCLAYGGIHAAAWNFNFPTDSERFLWRLSAIYFGCSGLGVFLHWGVEFLLSFVPKRVLDTGLTGEFPTDCCCAVDFIVYMVVAGLTRCFALIIFAPVLAYAIARTYLVVEAFYSLRDLPVGVYSATDWSRYLMHF